MYKACHLKTPDTVLLRYLAPNFVGFFGEINLISVENNYLNHLCDLEQVLSLI